MAMITDVTVLSSRLVRNNLRMPIFLIMSLTQPLMYLLLFGGLFSGMHQLAGPHAGSYIAYLTPGMMMLAALFGSCYLGVGTLGDVDRGMFDRLAASPVSRLAISLSYVAATLVSVLLQALLLLICGIAISGLPPGGPLGLLATLAVALLVGLAFGSASNALAFVVKRPEPILSLMNFVAMPLMFMSSMMLSTELMPHWVSVLSVANPVHWAVELGHASYNGRLVASSVQQALLLVGFALAMVYLMHRSFRAYLLQR